MPPGNPWSAAKLETFENWIDNGFQRVRAYEVEPSTAPRIRKDIHKLSESEKSLLKTAFAGLMARDSDIDDKFSFFNLTGVHWYPGPSRYVHCRHHDNEYNPWHRAYLVVFENALRSVPGCEEVTLPYWDILGDELPTWVFEEPFFGYINPHDLLDYTGQGAFKRKGDTIQRYDAAQIRRNVHSRLSPIPGCIAAALRADTWERFNGWSNATSEHDAIIEAHDNGHGACGPTISDPRIASFDPLFWLFHCNWDRLWWEWQRSQNAETLKAFKAKTQSDDSWLGEESINLLKPFDVYSSQMINLLDWNIDYAPSAADQDAILNESVMMPPAGAKGSASGALEFRISEPDLLSVRVKNINRLKIPGSFRIDLLFDGEIIATTRIFQPPEVGESDNCQRKGVFSKNFTVPADAVPNGSLLAVKLWQFMDDGEEREVDLADAGYPSVNVRHLLEEN